MANIGEPLREWQIDPAILVFYARSRVYNDFRARIQRTLRS